MSKRRRGLQFSEGDQRHEQPDVKPAKAKRRGKPVAPEPDTPPNIPNVNSAENADTRIKPDPVTPAATEKPTSKRKLQFAKQEQAIADLESKIEKHSERLGKAKDKLPTRNKLRKERVFDEAKGKSGKAKSKLVFEQEAVPIGEAKWNRPKKKSMPKKAVGAVVTLGVNKLHSKVNEVEDENVGTKAAHKGELVAESAVRGGKKATHSAYRFVRNAPYRKAAKLEVQSLNLEQKLTYQKVLRDNPKLASNPVSRAFQKRTIKRQYAKAVREAKKTGQAAKTTASVVSKAGRVVTGIVRKNPVFMVKIGILLLIIFMILALFSMCSTMFSGGMAAMAGTSYLSEDIDIETAELRYTEWETDLQIEIAGAETTHSGYDEYRYNVGDIGHNPFELMAFLTAVYEDFTYAEIENLLQSIFAEQYQLSYVEEVETRYADPDDADDDGDYEPYDWYILNVNLSTQPMTDILTPLMNTEQMEHFALLMRSKGNHQYVDNPFDMNWLPFVTSYYGYRIHPITGEKDYHKGVDVGLPAGTEIKAGFDGVVTTVGSDPSGFGNYLVVKSENGVEAKYAHCDSILVSDGQVIKKGDIIATVGNTGNSTGAHLHIEVVKDGQYLNPIFFVLTGDFGQGGAKPGEPGGPIIPEYPGAPIGDGSYADLITEAEKHLGKPYVFGANGPNSFDCSSFVCWTFTQSGVYNLPRTTAQGIYNQCTPISAADAKPGDIIFFKGTYSTPNTVTHVGIYVGNGQMIHSGKPCQYASINTNYWQSHFYSFGRLPN